MLVSGDQFCMSITFCFSHSDHIFPSFSFFILKCTNDVCDIQKYVIICGNVDKFTAVSQKIKSMNLLVKYNR